MAMAIDSKLALPRWLLHESTRKEVDVDSGADDLELDGLDPHVGVRGHRGRGHGDRVRRNGHRGRRGAHPAETSTWSLTGNGSRRESVGVGWGGGWRDSRVGERWEPWVHRPPVAQESLRGEVGVGWERWGSSENQGLSMFLQVVVLAHNIQSMVVVSNFMEEGG